MITFFGGGFFLNEKLKKIIIEKNKKNNVRDFIMSVTIISLTKLRVV